MNQYLRIFLAALLSFLGTCFAAATPYQSAIWAEPILFFCITVIFLNAERRDVCVLLCIIFGRLVLELPVRIFDFVGSLCSLYATIISVMAILAGYVYYRNRKVLVLIACTFALMIMNLLAYPQWGLFAKSIMDSH